LAGVGLPPFLVTALADFDEAQSRGYLAVRSPAVQELTGKPPTSVREYLTSQRAALAAA
jgi:NAD(P)H dehydrogenase (quinone)